MKKLLIFIAPLLILLLPGFIQAETKIDRVVKTIVKNRDSNDTKVYKIEKWVRDNIAYHSDNKQFNMNERWTMPMETLQRRKGDCEDYAILAQYVLGRGNILCVRSKTGRRHAVLIFWNNKKLYMLSTHNLKYLGKKRISYYRLAEMVFSDYTKWSIVDAEGYIIKGRFRHNVQD